MSAPTVGTLLLLLLLIGSSLGDLLSSPPLGRWARALVPALSSDPRLRQAVRSKTTKKRSGFVEAMQMPLTRETRMREDVAWKELAEHVQKEELVTTERRGLSGPERDRYGMGEDEDYKKVYMAGHAEGGTIRMLKGDGWVV